MSSLPALEQRTVTAAFERAVAAAPDETAHLDATGEWTFAHAFDRARRLAGGVRAATAGPVALMLDNHVDFVHTWLGIALAGRIQVPVNTAYVGRFLTHILNDSGAELIIAEARYAERIAAVAPQLTTLRTFALRGPGPRPALPRVAVIDAAELAAERPADPARSAPGDLMAYMYTSGTTGAAKGVEISHAHAYTYASREDQPRPTAADRILVTLPMFHLAGQWYGAYQALIHRATCVIEPGFSVSRFWDIVRTHGITETLMLGAMAELLQQAPPRADDAHNPLTLAPMAPLASDADAFAKRFAMTVEPVYGMSEIGAVLGAYGSELAAGEAGVARTSEYTLRLVDPFGADVPDGVISELLVRPQYRETVMRGYHGRPDQTAQALRDGWVHTGDAFRRADGHFFFADRMKDALRRRGENVSSFEVERALNEFPAVAESAVVGVPSELSEDEILAVLVPRPGARIDGAELIEFLVERLPYFMVPRYVRTVDELPRTPTQKVRKHVLRDAGAGGAWDREAAGIVVRRGGTSRRG